MAIQLKNRATIKPALCNNLAALAAQSTISCACSNERARTCRHQPTRGHTNLHAVNVQPLLGR